MSIDLTQLEDLVSVERGEIDRRIFFDPDIFEQEMEQIFGRAWLFLCHESQLRKTGDFFEAPMGRDNVLVVRQKDGTLRALLNTCAHRGNAVCRAEEGNTKNFMCTYHGWTYDLAGNLIGVPGLDQFYQGDLDRSQHGLRSVAQLDTYKGFIFGTMDPTAPPLDVYLGATGRLGLDLIAARGDMEVLPGIQKFIIDCNWKFTVDNLFDWYHPQITHMSAFQTGLVGGPPPSLETPPPPIDSSGVATPDGQELVLPGGGTATNSIAILGEYGHAISGPSISGFVGGGSPFSQEWRKRPEAQEALGPVGLNVAGHPNIFPTAWVALTTQLSLRIPRTPMQTEVWWFTFVDRNATPEEKGLATFMANHVFGPAGLLEQEDGENWSQSSKQTVGFASRKMPQLLKMNLGRGKIIKEHGLARIESSTSEHGQLWTYAAWAEYMRGASWDEIRTATTPRDYL
jgi:phenylpropionate dioxygenase-like ring-hydroxylating dioxygenase large terminal subunit